MDCCVLRERSRVRPAVRSRSRSTFLSYSVSRSRPSWSPSKAGRSTLTPSTVAVHGGRYYVPLAKANATAAAISAGKPFPVTLVPDHEPRVVTVPEDLAAALAESGLRERWERLSYSRQRKHAEVIAAAKLTDTRQRRLRQTIEALSD